MGLPSLWESACYRGRSGTESGFLYPSGAVKSAARFFATISPPSSDATSLRQAMVERQVSTARVLVSELLAVPSLSRTCSSRPAARSALGLREFPGRPSASCYGSSPRERG
jgi:hypothetical protein